MDSSSAACLRVDAAGGNHLGAVGISAPPPDPTLPGSGPSTLSPLTDEYWMPARPALGDVAAVHRRRKRLSHQALLTTVEDVHRRFGVTSERVLRSLHETATGVARFSSLALSRFVTASSARSSTMRTAVRKEALPSEDSSPVPGVSASVDLTRVFERSVDGFNCAAIFMDRGS